MQHAALPTGAKPSKGASKDTTRPHLNRGQIVQRGEQWELHVTDSWKAAILPLSLVGELDESGPALTEGPLSVDALKLIEKTGNFRANGAVEPCDQYGRPTGVTLARVDNGDRYPNLPQLFPDAPHADDTLKLGIDAKLLLELAEAIGAKAGKHSTVVLEFDATKFTEIESGGKQYLKTVVVTAKGERCALVMPVRVS
jgi:hypothetical protein